MRKNLVVGITGHGNVSSGVQEILELLNPVEIHPLLGYGRK